MNGNLQEKKPYAQSLSWSNTGILEILLLVMAGGLAAYMHFNVRVPLNIPGHHGLEFMGIITLIRLSSKLKYAGTLAMLGTGFILLMPGAGGGTMLHGFSYMLPGIMMDIAYGAGRERMQLLFIIAFTAGFAYMLIPLSRLILNITTGYPYMAILKHGAAYTLLSFFFFGMIGGLLGTGLNSIKNKFTEQKK
jgi:hypothetical protein